ncbi:phage head-tail adapter protein [Sutcliffiella sp. FSL R7-0096]|uniref:phage head completion protein n=1 Tax=Sutcliffiella sp. FSL R7-0096 TaxID=2921670 RepID=UPI00315A55F7
MQPFKYKPPKVNTGDLRTPVTFYQPKPNEGPEPGEHMDSVLYEAMAKIDTVWMKDIEVAKANGTLSDVTLTIRDPKSTFIPTNKHYIAIDADGYRDKRYNVKHVQPDLQNRQFIKVVARVVT